MRLQRELQLPARGGNPLHRAKQQVSHHLIHRRKLSIPFLHPRYHRPGLHWVVSRAWEVEGLAVEGERRQEGCILEPEQSY